MSLEKALKTLSARHSLHWSSLLRSTTQSFPCKNILGLIYGSLNYQRFVIGNNMSLLMDFVSEKKYLADFSGGTSSNSAKVRAATKEVCRGLNLSD